MDYQELSDFFVHLDRSYFIDNEMKEFADRDQPVMNKQFLNLLWCLK